MFTRALIDGILANAVATGRILDPAAVYVGLYITGPSPNPPATVAAFTLPDATDCPAQALGSWGPVRYLGPDNSIREAPAKVFALPDGDNAFSAGGWYLADAATGGNVLAWHPFETPIPMSNQYDSLTVIVRFGLPMSGEFDFSVTTSA